MPEPVIRVVHCWKSYGTGESQIHAVRDVSLEVIPGEFLVITGRSGSGKSTLLNLMGALDTPTRGSVLLGSRDLAQLSDRQRSEARRQDLATVFQSFNLLPTLRVDENVALPAHLLGKPVREIRREVDALLDAVGLGERKRAWPDSLSGGEMQRVALARALVNHPGIILADEPTGNLDTQNAERVLDLLVTLCRSLGTSIVMATHSSEGAARADRRVTMRDGQLEAVSP